jgi:HK97 family phage major capsid protein
MAPRSKNHLITLRDPNGNLIYPELRTASPSIHTFPMFVTNNIPTNLGTSSDESEIYLVNVSDCLIGETGGLAITVDSGAPYTDGGSVVSAFERDQTVIRAIMMHDFAVIHQESVAVKTGVKWGA